MVASAQANIVPLKEEVSWKKKNFSEKGFLNGDGDDKTR